MADDSLSEERSPLARPRFIIAVVVVLVLVAVGVVLAVVNLGQDDPAPEAQPAPVETVDPSPEPTEGTSVCGLKPVKLEGELNKVPESSWEYEGKVAFPVSEEFGPAAEQDGFPYCYARTPEGAVLMVANVAMQSLGGNVSPEWAEYIAARGPYRDEAVDMSDGEQDDRVSRASVRGVRLLSFDGSAATVDLAVSASTGSTPFLASVVMDLVWEDGDWKVSTDKDVLVDVGVIPDLAGYTAWGE